LENQRKGIELRKAALALQPQNRDLQRELALAYGPLSVMSNSQADERAAAQAGLSILEPLAASSPDDLQVQYALGRAYELIAPSFRTSDLERAREFYEKSMEIYEHLAKVDPKTELYQVDVSFAHKHLGSLLAEQNHLDEGLDHYRQALAMDETQLKAHPDDLNARYAITFTYSDTGFILGQRGDFDAAISYYRKALDIRAAMVAADPRDVRARGGLGNTYNYIGYLLRRKGNYSEALEPLKKSLSLREALAHDDPVNKKNGVNVAATQFELGQLYVDMATKTRTDSKKRAAFCFEARSWLQNALPIYLELQAKGELSDDQRETLVNMKQDLEQCGRLIASQPR
jgi:tetratricopeptide (TPR) repeat protein